MKHVQKMIHFRELRSGLNMPEVFRKAIKYNEWSGGKNAEHLGDFHVKNNSYWTVYDFDIKLEIMLFMLAIMLFLKRLLLK